MKAHIQELVLLHNKLTERYPKELADIFIDRLTLLFFMGGLDLAPDIPEVKNWVYSLGRNPSHFSGSINKAFESLPYYEKDKNIDLNVTEIDQVRKICSLDWKELSPFVFGRVFELTLEETVRSKLGAHYTPENDIRDLIEPVVFKGLRSHIRYVEDEIKGGVSAFGKRELVRTLLNHIRSVKVLDPACGTGNFLLICLWTLLDLESEAIKLASGVFETIPCVMMEQFYGIEKDKRAFKLMKIVLWLGYIQWMRKNFDENICISVCGMSDSSNFMNCDAILDFDDPVLPKERVWPEVDYIVGNPPYLGASKMRQLFGDEYCDILSWVFNGRVPASADFGGYWFEKSRDMIDRGKVKHAGFVISTSIKQEWSRPVLDRVVQSGKIFFAVSDRVWEGKEAAVHVSLIGFTGVDYSGDVVLNGEIVPIIYSNLSSNHNISELKQLKNKIYNCISGTGDALENSMDEKDVIELLYKSSPEEADKIRPFIGGRDLVQGSLNRWTICDSVVDEIRFSERRFLVTPRVSKYNVFLWLDSVILPDAGVVAWNTGDDYAMGILQSRVHRVWTMANCGWRGETRNYQIRSCFRSFTFPEADTLLIEEIRQSAEKLNRLRNEWLYPEKLVKKKYIKFCATKDGYWKNYSVEEVGDSLIQVEYPLIRPINKMADKILSKKTVTGLYNANPLWLQEVHKELDIKVLQAYGWDVDVFDEEIVTGLRLLNTNKLGESDIDFK